MHQILVLSPHDSEDIWYSISSINGIYTVVARRARVLVNNVPDSGTCDMYLNGQGV